MRFLPGLEHLGNHQKHHKDAPRTTTSIIIGTVRVGLRTHVQRLPARLVPSRRPCTLFMDFSRPVAGPAAHLH